MRNKYKNKRDNRLLKEQERKEELDKQVKDKTKKMNPPKTQANKVVTSKQSGKPKKPSIFEKVLTKFITKEKLDSLTPKDATSKFIVGFSILMLLALVLYISDLAINKKDYEGYITHFDENLNFSVDIPSKWSVGLPEEESLKEIINETTGGLTFDTRFSALTKEVAPLSLIQQDNSGKYPYKRLMVVSMFGPEDPIVYMNDHDTMEEEFKAILQELGHEGIRIEKVEDAYEGQLNGVLLYAKAFFEGKKMYYVHYTENLDKNVLRILYGSSDPIKKPKEIEEFMSTFLIHDTNILEQLMEQGISPEDLDVSIPPSPSEDSLSEEEDGTHVHEDGTVHSGSHDEEQSEGGIAKPTEDGKIELNLSPNFENEGDIESSETK